MTTQSTLRIFAHLWAASTFLALAFDPLGVKYEVAGTHLARRAGTLGGDTPAVTETGDSERPYEVDGNTFTDYDSAAQRSCNIQFNNCQLIANTDSSASFSLEDCQNQQDECLADPPAVADGSSSMSVASVNTSENTSDTSKSGAEDLEISADTAEAGTMGSNTGTTELSTTESDAEESDTSESNTASAESSAVGTDSTESKTAPDTAGPDTESDAMDSSGATESETAGSNTAEADSAGSDSKDADETVVSNAKPDTTEANPALVSQTTIPYDSEFDLVCDL